MTGACSECGRQARLTRGLCGRDYMRQRRGTGSRREPGVIPLIAEVLAGVPRLPGARCKGRAELWDEVDDPEVVEYATAQCEMCPALAACSSWADSLPARKHPTGVLAGRLVKRENTT